MELKRPKATSAASSRAADRPLPVLHAGPSPAANPAAMSEHCVTRASVQLAFRTERLGPLHGPLRLLDRTSWFAIAFVLVLNVTSSAAVAGAPLKGIDVKLGKNPGGSVASRMTDGSGRFNFGIVPRGSYHITLSLPEVPESARPKAIEIIVYSTAKGTVDFVLDLGDAARKSGAINAADFIVIISDGVHPVSGAVSSDDGPDTSLNARGHLRGTVTLIK